MSDQYNPPGYVLDTNVFNHLVEGKISSGQLPTDAPLYITDHQADEIAACEDKAKRTRMVVLLCRMRIGFEPTMTTVLGLSRLGGSALGDGKLFKEILANLDDKNKRKNMANRRDALIGELAIARGHTLISHDGDLCEAVRSLGGKTLDLIEKQN